MLSVKLTSCRDCAQICKLIDSINCQLAKMANNLYLNIAYMLDKPVEACTMSTLLHYKRILTYKSCNADWASDYSVTDIASRVNALTVGCKCCDEQSSGELTTTTTTTTAAPTTTTTTTALTLTAFLGTATTASNCVWPNFFEEATTTYYHDGLNPTPAVGDTVYVDSEGTIPLVTSELPGSPLAEGIPQAQGPYVGTVESGSFGTDLEGVVQVPGDCR